MSQPQEGSSHMPEFLIEINASKDLVKSVCFKLPSGKLRTQPVLYEFEPKFCAHCKVFGHTIKGCQAKNTEQESVKVADVKASESRHADGLIKASGISEAAISSPPSDSPVQVLPNVPNDPGPSDQSRVEGSSQALGHLAGPDCATHVCSVPSNGPIDHMIIEPEAQ